MGAGEMMAWSFVVGLFAGINIAGVGYWFALQRIRENDRAFREQHTQRLEELREWSARNYEQSRRDIGLPPRLMT